MAVRHRPPSRWRGKNLYKKNLKKRMKSRKKAFYLEACRDLNWMGGQKKRALEGKKRKEEYEEKSVLSSEVRTIGAKAFRPRS